MVPRAKSLLSLKKQKPEGGNEILRQDEEQRDSRSDDDGSKNSKYQCLLEEPFLVLQKFTRSTDEIF